MHRCRLQVVDRNIPTLLRLTHRGPSPLSFLRRFIMPFASPTNFTTSVIIEALPIFNAYRFRRHCTITLVKYEELLVLDLTKNLHLRLGLSSTVALRSAPHMHTPFFETLLTDNYVKA